VIADEGGLAHRREGGVILETCPDRVDREITLAFRVRLLMKAVGTPGSNLGGQPVAKVHRFGVVVNLVRGVFGPAWLEKIGHSPAWQ
jgi:hypothetical protein